VKVTYLIVPAVTDQAGQCRIVKRQHDIDFKPPLGLRDYRDKPELWKEAGIMNSRGELVCLDCTHPSHALHMKRDQPLMAGTTYTFIEDEEVE
jgi:hypothetical protein